MKARRFIDEEDFSPGYMARSMASFPRQGDREPWSNAQDYSMEKETLPGHMRQDKHGFPLITHRYATIGMPSCLLASQQ